MGMEGDADEEIIERLLDSLEKGDEIGNHGDSQAKSSSSTGKVAATKSLIEEAQEAMESIGPEAGPETHAEMEEWGALLNHFCADGDERVVDELLDKFLGSNCDAGSLIEALGRGMPQDQQPSVTAKPSQNKVTFGLASLEDLKDPNNLNSFDMLLGSARGVLQSAPKPAKRRPHSAHPTKIDVKKKRRPHSAHPASGNVPTSAPSKRKSKEPPPTADEVPSIESNEDGVDVRRPEARANLLARIAEMDDDAQALRAFMKRFLLGVRRRYMTGASVEDGGVSVKGCDDSSSDGEDDRTSCITVSVEATESELSDYG